MTCPPDARALTLVVLTLVAAARADAECRPPRPQLRAWQGSVGPGATCGAVIVTTDAASARVSTARAVVAAVAPYRLALQARRVAGDGGHAIQLELQGAYLLVRDGGWGFYVDEPQFAREGWHPVDGLDSRRDHAIVIERSAREVAIWLDGAALGRWAMPAATGDGPSLGLLGRRGARARLLVRDLTLTPLPTPRLGARSR